MNKQNEDQLEFVFSMNSVLRFKCWTRGWCDLTMTILRERVRSIRLSARAHVSSSLQTVHRMDWKWQLTLPCSRLYHHIPPCRPRYGNESFERETFCGITYHILHRTQPNIHKHSLPLCLSDAFHFVSFSTLISAPYSFHLIPTAYHISQPHSADAFSAD